MSAGFAETLQQVDRTSVLWRGRKLIYFGGCDYLRLSSHPRILGAARTALCKYGLNVAASRKTTGNHVLYEKLEEAARRFFKAPEAILTSSGYFANIVAAQALEIDHAFIDERAHASLRDALKSLGCRFTEFRHCDPADLKKRLGARSSGVAVLTDGMFSHDGSIAPLREYREIAGPEVLLWVDDAHGAGILGSNGRGTVELEGISRRNVLQTVTFSKAFGSYGGAILADREAAAAIVERSSALAGNTPLPLPLAAAALEALQLAGRPALRRKLRKNIQKFRAGVGLPASQSEAPIIALSVLRPGLLRRKLLSAGIHPPYISYAGGAQYFRFALSSEHTPREVEALAEVLAQHLCG